MSADLFAEFSNDSSSRETAQSSLPTHPQPASTFSFIDDLNSQTPVTVSHQQTPTVPSNFEIATTAPVQSEDHPDDDWGDFEGGPSHAVPAPTAQHDPFAFVSSQQPQLSQQEWSSQPMTEDLFGFQSAHPPHVPQESWTKAPVIKAKKPVDSNVLFDAEDDFEDDDDFGDFEDSQPKPTPLAPSAPLAPTGGSSGLVDLLGDLEFSHPAPSVLAESSKPAKKAVPKPKETIRKSPINSFATASKPNTNRQTKPQLAPAATSQAADDSWDTFDDWEASIPTPVMKKSDITKTVSPPASSAPASILSSAVDDIPSQEQPPTNVPPPGVLLSLFPLFFAEAQEKLFKPMAAQSLPMRNKLLAEQKTIAYLQGYMTLASVAAHIIAGRKMRWKRDQHLSQGMRIGPASSRATSGMKLTGIDRGENMKEEREASDVVRAWKDQIGRLRHVISGVNQIKAGTLGSAPDLQEIMPVRTLKQSEGGVPARQPCMLCGLKRDERVTAADMAIEDSFGEWWIDQVNMHRGCRNFWVEHKDKLRQR